MREVQFVHIRSLSKLYIAPQKASTKFSQQLPSHRDPTVLFTLRVSFTFTVLIVLVCRQVEPYADQLLPDSTADFVVRWLISQRFSNFVKIFQNFSGEITRGFVQPFLVQTLYQFSHYSSFAFSNLAFNYCLTLAFSSSIYPSLAFYFSLAFCSGIAANLDARSFLTYCKIIIVVDEFRDYSNDHQVSSKQGSCLVPNVIWLKWYSC